MHQRQIVSCVSEIFVFCFVFLFLAAVHQYAANKNKCQENHTKTMCVCVCLCCLVRRIIWESFRFKEHAYEVSSILRYKSLIPLLVVALTSPSLSIACSVRCHSSFRLWELLFDLYRWILAVSMKTHSSCMIDSRITPFLLHVWRRSLRMFAHRTA